MQRYFVEKKEDNYLVLAGSDLHHIKNVMRNKIGDKIEAIYKEKLYICQIESLDNNKVKIISEESENHELNTNITIAIALVQEQKFDLILQKLTELGISRIIPLKMERSIVKLDEKKQEKKLERWISICKEASEQSKRNKIPQISKITTIKELCKESFDEKYICSTFEKNNIISKILTKKINNKRILFVIGPEGGITPKEEEYMINEGLTPISLGTRIMRIETAAIYIASIANFYSLE